MDMLQIDNIVSTLFCGTPILLALYVIYRSFTGQTKQIQLYKLGYGGIALFALFFQYLFWAFDTEDCRGAGAPFPGGCPEYTVSSDQRWLLFIICELLLLALIIWRLRPTLARRPVVFGLFTIFVFFGWRMIYLLPLPSK